MNTHYYRALSSLTFTQDITAVLDIVKSEPSLKKRLMMFELDEYTKSIPAIIEEKIAFGSGGVGSIKVSATEQKAYIQIASGAGSYNYATAFVLDLTSSRYM